MDSLPVRWNSLWHLRGSVPLGEISDEQAIEAVAELSEEQWKPVTERGPDYAVFDSPIFRDPFGPRGASMAMFEKGVFLIERRPEGRRLAYDLRGLEMFMLFLSLAAAFLLASYATSSYSNTLPYIGFAFAGLYGINLIVAAVRVPLSLRKALRS